MRVSVYLTCWGSKFATWLSKRGHKACIGDSGQGDSIDMKADLGHVVHQDCFLDWKAGIVCSSPEEKEEDYKGGIWPPGGEDAHDPHDREP